ELLWQQQRVSVPNPNRVSCIYVLAGTNGAGKSSIAGATFLAQGAEYFNPDEAAARICSANPAISQAGANSMAWHQGKRLLEKAIAERLNFAFETTVGGARSRLGWIRHCPLDSKYVFGTWASPARSSISRA